MNLGSFMVSAQEGFDRHLEVTAARQKMTIAWNGERFDWRICVKQMKQLTSTYTASNETMQLLYNNNRLDFNARWPLFS